MAEGAAFGIILVSEPGRLCQYGPQRQERTQFGEIGPKGWNDRQAVVTPACDK